MIDSYTATYILAGFLVIFGVLLPILDKIPKVKSVVSFRWTIVVVYSAMCLGVIVDFEHLDTEVRFLVVLGGIILSSIFLFVRSIEKAAINKWELPHTRTSIKHGDVQAELSVSPKTIKEKVKEDTFYKKRERDVTDLMNSSLNIEDDNTEFTADKHK